MESRTPVFERLPRPQRALVSQVSRLISCSTSVAVGLLERAKWDANDAVDLFFTQRSAQSTSPGPSDSLCGYTASSVRPGAGFRALRKPGGKGRLTRHPSASAIGRQSPPSPSEPRDEGRRTSPRKNIVPGNLLPHSSPDAPICLEDTSDCGSPGLQKPRRRSCSPSSSVSSSSHLACSDSTSASASWSEQVPSPVCCGDAAAVDCSVLPSCRMRGLSSEVSRPGTVAGRKRASRASDRATREGESDRGGVDEGSVPPSVKRRPNEDALQTHASCPAADEARRPLGKQTGGSEGGSGLDCRTGGRKAGNRTARNEAGKVLRVLRDKYSWRKAVIEKGKAQLSSGDVGPNWKPYLGLVTLEATIVTAAFVKPDRALDMAFVGDIRVQLASGSSFFGSRKTASKLFRVDPRDPGLRREVAELLAPAVPSRVRVKQGLATTLSGRGLPPVLTLLDSISDSNCTLRLLLGDREAGRVQRTLSKELLLLLILGVIEVRIGWAPDSPPCFPLRVGSSVEIGVHVFLTSNIFRLEAAKNRIHLDLGSQCSGAVHALFSAVGMQLRGRQDCPSDPWRSAFSPTVLDEKTLNAPRPVNAQRVEAGAVFFPAAVTPNGEQCSKKVVGAGCVSTEQQSQEYRSTEEEVKPCSERGYKKKERSDEGNRVTGESTENEDEEGGGREDGSDDEESLDAMNRLNDFVLGAAVDAGVFPDTFPSMSDADTRSVLPSAGQDVIRNSSTVPEESYGCLARVTPHPHIFRTKLRPYQEEGLAWMLSRETDIDCRVSKQHFVGESPEEELQSLPPSWFRVEFPPVPPHLSSSVGSSEREGRSRKVGEEAKQRLSASSGDGVENRLFCNFEACAFSVSRPAAARVVKGGILGDAMGLGKTVQLLALVSSDLLPAKASVGDSPVEVVGSGATGTKVGKGLSKPGKEAEAEADEGDDRNYSTPSRGTDETESEEKALCFPPPAPEAIAPHLKPDAEGFFPGGTLIVVPLSLLSQWRDEIAAHFHPGIVSVYEYYGTSRTKDLAFLASHTIVLTTYQTLASDFRAAKPGTGGPVDFGQRKTSCAPSPGGAVTSDASTTMHEKEKGAGKTLAATVSPLHAIFFYRIVLDEGHLIKSVQSSQCQAACALHGERRWMLTGTPLQNDVSDAFALAKFLKLLPAGTTAWWNAHVAQPMERGQTAAAIGAVRSVLLPLMLRRHANSRGLDGKPILPLPPITFHCFNICLTPFERELYMAFFTRSREEFERLLTAGVVMTNYSHVLLLLLRLRQLCCHPSLVTARSGALQRKLLSGDLTEFDKLLASIFSKETPTGTGAKPSSFFVNSVVQEVREGRIEDCPICLDFPAEPVLLVSCCHTLCHTCALNLLRRKRNECPICRVPFQPQHVKLLPPPSMILNSSSTGDGPEGTHQQCQADGELEIKKEGKDGDAEREENKSRQNGFFFSTKLKIALALVSEDIRQGRSCVIFSQWTSMLDTIEEAFAEYERFQRGGMEHTGRVAGKEPRERGTTRVPVVQLPYRRLDGSMTSKQRQDVLAWFANRNPSASWGELGKESLSEGEPIIGVFRDLRGGQAEDAETALKKRVYGKKQEGLKGVTEDKDCQGRILLCSLKAGNVGLNLTRASRCYLMDSWWNPQVENQAMKRIWRFGQDKPVEVIRFVCIRTVEERLEEIKEFKGWMARGVCDSGAGVDNVDSHCMPAGAKTDSFEEDKQRGRLSVNDLKRLFEGFETEELAGAEILECHKYPGPRLLLLEGDEEISGVRGSGGAVEVALGASRGPADSSGASFQQTSERSASSLRESPSRTWAKLSPARTSDGGPNNDGLERIVTGQGSVSKGAQEGPGPLNSSCTSKLERKASERNGENCCRELITHPEGHTRAGLLVATEHGRRSTGTGSEDRTACSHPSDDFVHSPAASPLVPYQETAKNVLTTISVAEIAKDVGLRVDSENLKEGSKSGAGAWTKCSSTRVEEEPEGMQRRETGRSGDENTAGPANTWPQAL